MRPGRESERLRSPPLAARPHPRPNFYMSRLGSVLPIGASMLD